MSSKTGIKNLLLNLPGFEAFCRRLTRGHVRALMYHRFRAAGDDGDRMHSDELLAEQLAYIRRHHAIWTPRRHLESLTHDHRPDGNCPVVVTVDDGYADFHDHAFPVFERLQVPVMLFVTTGFIDGRIWLWWDMLSHLTNSAPDIACTIVAGGRPLDLDFRTPQGRRDAWNRIADRCRFIPHEQKMDLMSRLAAIVGIGQIDRPPAAYAPVTWEQIRQMSRSVVSYGAHTVTHPILSRMDSGDASREILDSKERLEAELEESVSWFCYPQGGPADYTEAVRQIVADDFEGCYVAYQDMENRGDPYTMPRYSAPLDDTSFRWILCGAEYMIMALKKRLGRPLNLSDAYWSGSGDVD